MPKYQADVLLAALEAGKTIKDLAEHYKITVQSMSNVLSLFRKNGQLPPAPNTKIKLTLEMEQELRCSQRGGSISFARKYGINRATVSKMLGNLGIRRWTPVDWFNFDAEIIRKRTELKMSGRQIAIAMEISPSAVQVRLRLYGLNGYIRPERKPRKPRIYDPTKRKSRAKVKPPVQAPILFYPEGSEGHELWNKAAKIISSVGIADPQIRKDLTQELCVAVLLGDVQENEMNKWIRKARASVTGSASDPRNLSLDMTYEGGGSLYDMIAAE